MNRERAAALAAEITAAIAAAGLTGSGMTDGTAAGAELAAGTPALIVQPPAVEFHTRNAATASWEVIAAAGPVHDADAAWDTLDQLVEVLAPVLDVDRTEPAQFQPMQGEAVPAYVLKFTEQYTIT